RQHIVVLVRHCQDQYPSGQPGPTHLSRNPQAVAIGHGQNQNCDVLWILGHGPPCLSSRRGYGRHLHVLFRFQDRPQTCSEDRMVVGEDEPNHRSAPRSSGRVTATSVPPPSGDQTRHPPPTSTAQSCIDRRPPAGPFVVS